MLVLDAALDLIELVIPVPRPFSERLAISSVLSLLFACTRALHRSEPAAATTDSTESSDESMVLSVHVTLSMSIVSSFKTRVQAFFVFLFAIGIFLTSIAHFLYRFEYL